MNGLNMDNVLESLLEATGGNKDIKQAIDSKDLAATVRAATEALIKSLSIPMRLAERKSAEESNKFRKEGNLFFLNKNYKEAILNYNKALAYAPNNSLELKITYSNISAVMLTIKEYKTCQIIAKTALDLECPAFLRVKLEKRLSVVSKCISENYGTEMINRVDKIDMQNYVKFDVKRNAEIPCASADVCVNGGKIVAANEIKSGTIVALERAFVSVQDVYEENTSCYYCHKMSFLFLIPCEGCCKALFCSSECREKCLVDYHRIECHIVAYMGSLYERDVNKLAVRAAIKMSLKLGWEELRVASLCMGKTRLQKCSVAEAFDCNNPTSILCYDDDEILVPDDKMKNASLVCAAAVHCLGKVPEYLPEEGEERETAIDSLSRIILHLNTTFLRKVMITSSASDILDETYRCGAQRNGAWFSFTSKLAHSCEPNLLVLGFNDHVALVAIQRIIKGEPLNISYVEHFYEWNVTNMFGVQVPKSLGIRQKQIYDYLQYKCKCRVCLRGWNCNSQVEGSLTHRQRTAYNLSLMAMVGGTFVQKMKAIGASLDELTGCSNTIQHYNSFGNLRRTTNICQCVVSQNKVYGGVSKHTSTERIPLSLFLSK